MIDVSAGDCSFLFGRDQRYMVVPECGWYSVKAHILEVQTVI